jgi:hypothetical protein
MRTLYKTTITSDKRLTYLSVEVDSKHLYINTTVEQEGAPGCLISVDIPLSLAYEIRTALAGIEPQS